MRPSSVQSSPEGGSNGLPGEVLRAAESALERKAEEVVALDLEGGAELWGFPVGPDRQEFGPYYATPLVNGDVINVGGYGDGELYALARERGPRGSLDAPGFCRLLSHSKPPPAGTVGAEPDGRP